MVPKKYAAEDIDIIDYDYYQIPGTDKCFRGPQPEMGSRGHAVSFLGAASCFGRFVEHPYPELLGRMLARPIYNFGYGGARAPFYYRDAALMALINQSAAVVIEIFSARGVATASIASRDDSSAFLRWAGSDAPFMFADNFLRAIWASSPARLNKMIAEIRERYVEQMHALLWQLHVPVVLLWLSQRLPDDDAGYQDPESYEFSFPHLVDRAMLEHIAQRRVTIVEVVSRAGLPHRLPRRDASVASAPQPPEVNNYYPSPEMHQLAADRLTPVLARLVG